MKIYHYSSETGEYIGQGLADPDPLVKDGWLIPAHATTTEPPVQSGKAAVWTSDSWTLVDDFRGQTWFIGHGKPFVITTLAVPDGAVRVEPPAPPSPPAPPRVIAGAYFRAALTDLGHMTNVRAALTNPIDLELFNTATEFNDQAPDVNAVATALNIDLASVFDAAEAIRAARQPAA